MRGIWVTSFTSLGTAMVCGAVEHTILIPFSAKTDGGQTLYAPDVEFNFVYPPMPGNSASVGIPVSTTPFNAAYLSSAL